jgi:AbrB family transcriptional regulator (stage V sporulation protein T)
MNEDREYTVKSQVIAPIITQGDPIGAVIIVTKEPGVRLGDMEVKLAETAAGFLAKQMEQ